MACGFKADSNPVGMSDNFDGDMVAMSLRSTGCSMPPVRSRTRLFAVSAEIIPSSDVARLERDGPRTIAGLDRLAGVENGRDQPVHRFVADHAQISPDLISFTAQAMTRYAQRLELMLPAQRVTGQFLDACVTGDDLRTVGGRGRQRDAGGCGFWNRRI